MRVAFLALALSSIVALAPAVSAADSICSAAEKCYITGGSKVCDRTKADCPPCLYKRFLSTSYQCYYLDDVEECPDQTTYCPPTSGSSSSSSGSSSGSSTPEPTKKTPKPTTSKPSPTKKPTGSDSEDGSKSESGSGEIVSTKTPKPTTAKPTTKPPTTTTPTPTPSSTPNVTESAEPLATSSPSNAQSDKSDSSSTSKLPLILGIACGAFVVVAVIAFLVWKRRRDDDDDSDDDDFRFNPPKPTGRPGAAAVGGSIATTASYNNSDQMRVPTSPGSKATAAGAGVTSYAAVGAGAQYGGSQYSSGANQYGQYGAPPPYGAGAANDYGSPSTIDGSSRNLFASGVNPSYDNRDSLSDSSNDGRDVWGNQSARPAPGGYATTSSTGVAQQPTYQREKRTYSNVSVEF